VRGKLRGDPIFKALIEQSVFADDMCILDLGCGKGLLAAWLLAAEKLADAGQWLNPMQPARNLSFRGIDIEPRDILCGNKALMPAYNQRIQLISGDMRCIEMRNIDAVVLLDVLHYISHADQDKLLDDIRASLKIGGVLLTRVSDARLAFRLMLSKFIDRCVAMIRGHGVAPLFCRSLPDWINSFEQRGFAVTAFPMSQSTPFANVMLVARAI
jgi:SAM-dependent methyltransferase